MHKKILIIGLLSMFLITGCTPIKHNLDEIVMTIMNHPQTVNTVSTNYELYVPIGVMPIQDNEYNQIFKIKDQNIYLYIDTVSYYYKNKLNYPQDQEYNYYYKKLDHNMGYLGINQVTKDTFFTKSIYNYTKVEFYANQEDLGVILANALIIQKSIKFNDELIKKDFENNNIVNRKVKYELDRPKDSESTFSKYLQEYVSEEETEVKLPDGN